VQALISEFKGDYDHMADHLKIMNKRMVLLNPKFTNRQASKSVSPDKDKGGLNSSHDAPGAFQTFKENEDISLG